MYHVRNLIVAHDPRSIHNPLFIFSSFGEHGVDIFFVVCGCCIAQAAISASGKPSGALGFLIARIRRIYPPYIAATAMAILLLLATRALLQHSGNGGSFPIEYNVPHGFAYYAANLTLTQKATQQGFVLKQAWTLCYEAFFYLLFSLLAWTVKKSPNNRDLLIVSHGLTLATLLMLIIAPNYAAYPLDLYPIFGIGVSVYDVLKHQSSKMPLVWFVIISLLMVGLAKFSVQNRLGGVNPFNGQPEAYCYLVGVIFAVLLVLLRRFDDRIAETKAFHIISAIGIFSYSLYLSHGFVIFSLHLLLGRNHFNDFVVFTVAVGLSILVGRIFFQFFERPFLSSFRKTIILEEEHPIIVSA